MKKKTILFLALLAIIASGVFAYHKANEKKAYDYSEFYEEVPVTPAEEKTEEVQEEETEMVLSLSLLKQRNSDVVGILIFDDKVIYEPIVQAPNNDYYVRKNIDKKYSAAGIPFISSDCNLNSKNIVVYGHSSAQSVIIFTTLMNYVNKSYYTKHPTFKLELESTIREYQIFAVMGYDTKDISDSLEFTQSSWRKDEDFTAFVDYAKQNSFYDTKVNVSAQDKIITLVTCDNRDFSKRVIVLAKLIKS